MILLILTLYTSHYDNDMELFVINFLRRAGKTDVAVVAAGIIPQG